MILRASLYRWRMMHSKRMRHQLYTEMLDDHEKMKNDIWCIGLCQVLMNIQIKEQRVYWFMLEDLKELEQQRERPNPRAYWWDTDPYTGTAKRIQVLENAIEWTRPRT